MVYLFFQIFKLFSGCCIVWRAMLQWILKKFYMHSSIHFFRQQICSQFFIQLCNNNSKISLILKAFILCWHILVDIGLYWHSLGLDYKFFKVFSSNFSDNTNGKRINDSKEKYTCTWRSFLGTLAIPGEA